MTDKSTENDEALDGDGEYGAESIKVLKGLDAVFLAEKASSCKK